MEEKNTAKDNQQEESRQESEKQAVSADTSPKPKRKKKSPTEKKLKPHLLDETIKLNDLYYSFHQEELEQILYFNSHPPVIDEQFKKEVERERFLFN